MALSGSVQTSTWTTSSGNTTYSALLTWTATQSIANNASTINWTLTLKATNDYGWVVVSEINIGFNGTSVFYRPTSTHVDGQNGTVLATGSNTISHNSDGTKSLKIYVGVGIYQWAINVENTQTFTLNQIPRQANLTYAPSSFTDEQNPIIQYQNSAGNNVTSLQACISLDGGNSANIDYRDVSKTGTAYTFNLTTAERNTIRSYMASKNSQTVTFILRTVIAGNTYYSTKTGTISIVNANPTIGGADYWDNNSKTVNITGNSRLIVRNNSVLLVTATELKALKSATLSSISVTCNNKTVSSDLTGMVAPSTSLRLGTVDSGQNVTATIKLTDSRGNTATKTLTVQMADWVLPSALINCQRESNYYSNTTLYVNGEISSINGKNVMTIKARYKKTTDSSYGAYITLQDEVATTLDLDNNYQWNVQVVVSDLIGSTTYNLVVDRGIPIAFFDRQNRSVGINKFPDAGISLDVSGKVATDGVSLVANTVSGSKEIRYSNDSTSANPHDVSIYGGNPSSGTALGVWDYKNNRYVGYYNDATNQISIGNSGATVVFASDTGWNTITANVAYYRIARGICFVSVASYNTVALTANAYKTIGTLPAGARPNTNLVFPVSPMGTSSVITGQIGTDGQIKLSSNQVTGYYAFVISFPVF